MKRVKLLLTSSFLVMTCFAKAQTPTFTIVVSPADSLRKAGDLNGAIEEFRKIYLTDSTDGGNIYNFACALAITNQKDSCFKYLYKSIELDTFSWAFIDPDFISIKDDKRWIEFEDKLIALLTIRFGEPLNDVEYAKELWRMRAKDQAYYKEIELAEKKIGLNSTVVKALWTLKHIYNEENQKKIESLVEQKGWPRSSDVGGDASNAAFLVIQHSDNEKQKKYLPMIEKLCRENEASWHNYSLMYDRILTNENKPQKYGSQVIFNEKTKKYELLPLLDETKVDEWRKEIGLGPLADYVAVWEIEFEPKKK